MALCALDGNGGQHPNYFPNSFDNISDDPTYKHVPFELDSKVADNYDRNAEGENDHYHSQEFLERSIKRAGKKNLVNNIVGAMRGISGTKKEEIINRQLCHFFRAELVWEWRLRKDWDWMSMHFQIHIVQQKQRRRYKTGLVISRIFGRT